MTSAMAAGQAKEHLGRVQALRFFAAFAVLFAHAQHEVAERLLPGARFATFTLIDGGFGVDIFFLISGFIIYHISRDEFARPRAAGAFLTRRFLRVAPLYYVATLLLLLTIAVARNHVNGGAVTVPQAIASFLFIPYANAGGLAVPILKLGWTLNYEAYFYATFAAALLFPRRIGFAVMLCTLLLMIALHNLAPGHVQAIDVWGDTIVFEFVAGIVVAILYHRGWRVPVAAGWAMIAAGIVLIGGLRLIGLLPILPRFLFAGVPAAMIVAGVVFSPMGASRGPLMRALEMLGDASYALYLFHPFAIRGAVVMAAAFGIDRSPGLLVAAILVAALSTAVFINRFVERPLDRFLQHRLGRRAPLRAAS
jgi:exopolysaccharide production protein ExoZ